MNITDKDVEAIGSMTLALTKQDMLIHNAIVEVYSILLTDNPDNRRKFMFFVHTLSDGLSYGNWPGGKIE